MVPRMRREEKDAKRQRSEPTTPRSTSSRPPREYDEVMGITQVKPRDAERFEEGIDSDFQHAEEVITGETGARKAGTIDSTRLEHPRKGKLSCMSHCLPKREDLPHHLM